MLTQANWDANLKTAKARALKDLGIKDAKTMTQDQLTAYNKALAGIIIAYPGSFSPQSLETARIVSQRNYTPLQDPSISFGDFVEATYEEGKTVIPAFKNWTLGIAIAALIFWLIFVASSARQNLKS